MSVRRVYVEKKKPYAVKADELKEEINSYLGIKTVTDVRVLVRYDVENLSEEVYREAVKTIFSEPPVDLVYEGAFPAGDGDRIFAVEYLPGQFDQRADSAVQCVRLLKESEEPAISSAAVYVIGGELSEEQLHAVKNYCINPVDSREASMDIPETLTAVFQEPQDVKLLDGFSAMPETELSVLYDSLNLAMTFKDFLHIRNYFAKEEKRNPTMTEIRVLDTYWSDHCRHTTFHTELKHITFTQGDYNGPVEGTYRRYMKDRQEVQADSPVCLMDLALAAMRKLKKEGRLEDQEESDEINACSIVVPAKIGGETEEWLINFKNETHNHPTEIEPFGGAATCLGGAIRDPLSGRTYVYQAMRITGAADPTAPVSRTMKGKLPQKKLVRGAAAGYSSYGNQIGLATGYVKEIYHPNYAAKRMEIGAVLGAAPRRAVRRLAASPGDVVILLGGRTGRDGLGGATGSSKVHTEESIESCGAEVQKGNPPTERKLQRLFRREEVSVLIKKCNDFGAGGVSVAIGELADGLFIQLDKVPKKYAGLDGTEIAISESQERMAVVTDPSDVETFIAFAEEENLEAVPVAVVTESPRLTMEWRGKIIVDISRAFLDTNGARQETDVTVEIPVKEGNPFGKRPAEDVEKQWLDTLRDLNVCSQKGLVEMFDSSIGAGSVYMPYGGKYQMTETQVMAARLPVRKGTTDTATMMSYGFDPYLSSWSPYHGAVYAVVSSVAKITAAGGDYKKIRFTFQEYFKRMTEDSRRWGVPFSALLGAYEAQIGFGLPAIGGKDSMSGSFQDLDVPPTLVSFAVAVADSRHMITPELKKAGNKLVLFMIRRDKYDLPDYRSAVDLYEKFYEDVKARKIISAYELERGGLCEALSKMAMGNRLGVRLTDAVNPEELFAPGWGYIVAEVDQDYVYQLEAPGMIIGEVIREEAFIYRDMKLTVEEAQHAWTSTLEPVFPTRTGAKSEMVEKPLYHAKTIHICTHKIGAPSVFIPVFPGTNCEYDSERAFEEAGAAVTAKVFRNMTAVHIRDSVDCFVKQIDRSQIIMLPGGFSAGDEPEGSAKFIAAVFRNGKVKDAVNRLLKERDGLILGICNGFQALIKLGLLPYGEIRDQTETSPTLTGNRIGRHVSRMVYTRVISNQSPWLSKAELGGIYCVPVSHGEGRFVAGSEWIEKLFANGQVATRYVDLQGVSTMDDAWNPNGSYFAIEGISSPDGRILGKMAHSERRGRSVAVNTYGEQDMKLFRSGVEYFA